MYQDVASTSTSVKGGQNDVEEKSVNEDSMVCNMSTAGPNAGEDWEIR